MNLVMISYYFLLLLVAIVTTYIAFNLQKKYPIKYISLFFHYVILTYVYAILVYAVPELFYSIPQVSLNVDINSFLWLIILFSLPITFIALYLFVSFFTNLKNGKIPVWINRIFFVVFVVYFSSLGVLYIIESGSSDFRAISKIYLSLGIIAALVRIGVIIYTFLSARENHSRVHLKLIRTLCWHYFIGFVVYYFICHGPYQNVIVSIYLRQFVYFVLNIPPLFYMKNYMKRYFIRDISGLKEKVNFELLFEKYNLTQREREIFLMMAEGNTNSDIKNKLYLSIKTVKNHIYSIYKKLGIDNRIQLFALLQDFSDAK